MKNRNRPNIAGTYFLGATLAAYLIIAIVSPEQGMAALQKSMQLFLMLLPVFAAVILLTAALGYWLRPDAVAKHLGKESGIKGWTIALSAGILSHGPMYAWYPMLAPLKQQGMGNALITVFLYARAIKLPLLPVMIDYFGMLFTLILTFYIILGALLQGMIIAWIKI